MRRTPLRQASGGRGAVGRLAGCGRGVAPGCVRETPRATHVRVRVSESAPRSPRAGAHQPSSRKATEWRGRAALGGGRVGWPMVDSTAPCGAQGRAAPHLCPSDLDAQRSREATEWRWPAALGVGRVTCPLELNGSLESERRCAVRRTWLQRCMQPSFDAQLGPCGGVAPEGAVGAGGPGGGWRRMAPDGDPAGASRPSESRAIGNGYKCLTYSKFSGLF
jgi:hypothetical protein